MPFYHHLDGLEPAVRRRTIERLLLLRQELNRQVPRRSARQLLLATWNIREFGAGTYGPRGWEPLYYIAEILSHFDLIAIAEVRADLNALEQVMSVLGSKWDYIVTDVAGPKGTAGNDERLAVLYDSTTVSFGGLAGELVLPAIRTTDDAGNRIEVPAEQFARTPLLAGFRADWLKFMLAVLHVRWGDGSTVPEREVRTLVEQVTARQLETTWAADMVLLGDFNIGSPTDAVWEALRAHGWTIPSDFAEGIRGTNVAQNKFYDQIALRPRPGWFELVTPTGVRAAGVFNFFDAVYRPRADFDTYIPEMKKLKRTATTSNFTFDSKGNRRTVDQQRSWYRNYWRTYQMSDHLPLWVSLRSDYTDDYLTGKLQRL